VKHSTLIAILRDLISIVRYMFLPVEDIIRHQLLKISVTIFIIFFLSDFENLVLMMDSKPGKIYHII